MNPSPIKHLLHRLLSWIWYGSATLLIVAAIGVGVARILFSATDQYHSGIEREIGNYLGVPVSIEKVDVTWRGVRPVLKLDEVAFYEEAQGQPVFSVGNMQVALSLRHLFMERRAFPARISIEDTIFPLARDPEGRLVLTGFPTLPNATGLSGLLAIEGWFSLVNCVLELHPGVVDERLHILTNINLHLNNQATRHLLKGDLDLPDSLGKRLHVTLDMDWLPESPDTRKMALYVEGDALDLHTWSLLRKNSAVQVAGKADIDLWAHFSAEKLQKLDARLQGSAVQITAQGTNSAHQDFEEVGGVFFFSRDDTHWQLTGNDFYVQEGDVRWPDSGFIIERFEVGPERGLRANFDYLNLQQLVGTVAVLKDGGLPDVAGLPAAEKLNALDLQGELRNAQFAWQEAAGSAGALSGQATFSRLGFAAQAGYPGVRDLHGSVQGNNEQGRIELHSEALIFDQPALFRAPLVFDTAHGVMQWSRDSGQLVLRVPEFVVDNVELHCTGEMFLELPANGDSPWLDMQVEFNSPSIAFVSRYLPAVIMRQRAVQWLDVAMVAGRISDGKAVFSGKLADFPFDAGGGRFYASCKVEDAVLDYTPGWPRIDGLDALVEFENRGMQIHSSAGRIFSVELGPVNARISDLSSATLKLGGNPRGSIADMQRFLRESPLSDAYGDALGPLRLRGDAKLDLDLNIPLHGKRREVTVNGRLHFLRNRLLLEHWGLALEALSGRLAFTRAGVTSQGLQGTLWDKPVELVIGTNRESPTPETRVTLSGSPGLIERLRQQDWRLLTDRMQGEAHWLASLRIPASAAKNRRDPVLLEVTSDLRGVTIDMPGILGKQAEDAVPFRLLTHIDQLQMGVLDLSYGDRLQALMMMGPAGMERGELRFGGAPAVLPDSMGLRLAGNIPVLNVEEWNGLIQGAQTDAAMSSALKSVGIHVGHLNFFGKDFRGVGIQAQVEQNGWRIDLQGSDLQGKALWAAEVPGRERLVLNFEHLLLDSGTDGDLAAKQPQELPAPDRLPALDMTISRFVYDGQELGEFRLLSVPSGSGLQVEKASLQSDLMSINATGDWLRETSRQVSRFDIRLQAEHLGKLLETFGYRGGVEGGKTALALRANWEGAPSDFRLARLEGSLDIDISEGVLQEIDPGAGRVFGLLSLQSLPRRLSLDFRDLFEKGFRFDAIKGRFALLEGDAFTDDLSVDGPSAKIEISGRTGFAQQDYDQVIIVTPKLRSSLPMAGAIIAGGPAVGAALLITDLLFPGQMDELTSFTRINYQLTGRWEQPVLERLQPSQEEPQKQSGESSR